MLLDGLQGRRHRTTILVPEHHDEVRAEVADRIFDAAHPRRIDDIAGHADDEQVAEPLIEDDLRGSRESEQLSTMANGA